MNDQSSQQTGQLLPGDELLLWCGAQDFGAMSSEGAESSWEACKRLVALGLLVHTEQNEHIAVYHTTRAGLAALGKTVQ